MKKIVQALAILVCSTTVTLAQTENEKHVYRNHLTIEPLTFLAGGIQIGYERNLGSRSALKILAGYYHNQEPSLLYPMATRLEGGNIQLTAKRFFQAEESSPTRFYMGALGLFKLGELDTMLDTDYPQMTIIEEKTYDASAIGVGTVFGLSIYTQAGFHMDISLGGMMNFSLSPREDAEFLHAPLVNPYLTGVAPRMNFGIGYSF